MKTSTMNRRLLTAATSVKKEQHHDRTTRLSPISFRCLGLCLAASCLASIAFGQFTYVVNEDGASVSGYANSAGALTPVLGSPFPTGNVPTAVSVDPALKFAFVSNSQDNNVSAFKIDPATGALTAVAGSPFPTGNNPQALVVDPTGRFLYVTSYSDGKISGYSIDATSGVLTAIAGSPFAAGVSALGVAVSPTGQFAYVVNQNNRTVSGYSIDSTSGALAAVPGSPFLVGHQPRNLTVDQSGKFVYVANLADNNVTGFAIDGATGTLTAIAGSPFGTGRSPFFIASANGVSGAEFVYVPNLLDANVSGYSVDTTTGVLTAMAGSPFPAGNFPSSVGMDASQQFAYVPNFDDHNVSAYAIDPVAGGLTAVAGSPFGAGAGPLWASITPVLTVQIGDGTTGNGNGKGSSPLPPINSRSHGLIPVKIVSKPSASIDPSTLTIGKTGLEASVAMCTGPADQLTCHVDTQLTGLQPGDTVVSLRGATTTGAKLRGKALVTVK